MMCVDVVSQDASRANQALHGRGQAGKCGWRTWAMSTCTIKSSVTSERPRGFGARSVQAGAGRCNLVHVTLTQVTTHRWGIMFCVMLKRADLFTKENSKQVWNWLEKKDKDKDIAKWFANGLM